LRSYENKSEEALTSPPDDRESMESHLEEAETSQAGITATIPDGRIEVSEEDVPPERQKRGWRFSPPRRPSREQLWTMIAFWGVVLLGAVLRFWDLGAKPLHWDESLHAYYSMQLLHNNIQNWASCLNLPAGNSGGCYRYDPLLHGPFQFHAIALVYLISQFLGAPDHGINTTTVRIAAALFGTIIIGLPYFLRQYLGKIGAWLACFLLAVSPSMVYFSRFAREDIYMACFTLLFIVAVIQYVRTRKIGWAILAALAFVLSYATKEATFLSIAVFGSFAGALLVWEIASHQISKRQASLSPALATADSASLQSPPVPTSEIVLHESAEATASTDVDDTDTQTESSEEVDDNQPSPVAVSEVQRERRPAFSFLENQNIFLKRVFALLAVLVYFVVIGIPAILLLSWTKKVSIYTNVSPANMNAAQAIVDNYKNLTVQAIPWLGILLAAVVFFILWREWANEDKPQQRRGLASRIDPKNQRLLDTIVTMPWTHWFFALVVGWTVFLVLFTALFTYMPGIGDGVWQGIFYWITQQTVARGGEPWYYYFMLIPLYEQIGLLFGLVGIIYCLMHPTRFRLFMVYWFIGNFFIYTWAGEKMPWLVIHLTMPLMILAAIGLRPTVERLIQFAKDVAGHFALEQEKLKQREERARMEQGFVAPTTFFSEWIITVMIIVALFVEAGIALLDNTALTVVYGVLIAVFCAGVIVVLTVFPFRPSFRTFARWNAGRGIAGGILAILALILTLQNMYQVTYPHPADAKSEMLIYVQTTPYVNTVMDKIVQADQKYDNGNYELPIGVTADASWPFSWYLRDYKDVAYNCTADTCKNDLVVISAGDGLAPMYAQNGPGQYSYSSQYVYQTYEMRAQGNQGYMPPPCIPTKGHPCDPQQYTGVGLGVWLSWGANPPQGATFNLGRASMRVWQWWWQRIPIGRGVTSRGDQAALDDQGAMMSLFIRKDLHIAP
jgi:uncharacterized protein (TIGR03663 family)